jgi:hypothetical protein
MAERLSELIERMIGSVDNSEATLSDSLAFGELA